MITFFSQFALNHYLALCVSGLQSVPQLGVLSLTVNVCPISVEEELKCQQWLSWHKKSGCAVSKYQLIYMHVEVLLNATGVAYALQWQIMASTAFLYLYCTVYRPDASYHSCKPSNWNVLHIASHSFIRPSLLIPSPLHASNRSLLFQGNLHIGTESFILVLMGSINTTARASCHIFFPCFQGQGMTVCTIHISKYKSISVRLWVLVHRFLPTYSQRPTVKWCYAVFHMEKHRNAPTTSERNALDSWCS